MKYQVNCMLKYCVFVGLLFAAICVLLQYIPSRKVSTAYDYYINKSQMDSHFLYFLECDDASALPEWLKCIGLSAAVTAGEILYVEENQTIHRINMRTRVREEIDMKGVEYKDLSMPQLMSIEEFWDTLN